jgi:hypothetical protein
VAPAAPTDAAVARGLVPAGPGHVVFVGPEGTSLPGESRLAFLVPEGWISARVDRWDGAAWSPVPGVAQAEGEVQVSGARLGWFRLVEAVEPAPPPRPVLAAALLRPNPFGSATRLEFSLSAPDRVVVEVFDIQGALVRRLLDARLAGGAHVVSWDGHDDRGRGAVPGVYFVRVAGGGAVLSRKVVRIGGGAP